ncbi:MAG: type II secretion system ATPase GspE [Candidatus Omnitrophota bacterium]
MMQEKKSLGFSLVEAGLLGSEELKLAEKEAKKNSISLRKAILKLGIIEEDALVSFLSTHLGIPSIDLSTYLIDPAILQHVPKDLAEKYDLIPVFKIGDTLTCAMSEPLNIVAQDEIRLKTGFNIEAVVARESDIKSAIYSYYGEKTSVEDVVKELEQVEADLKSGREIAAKRLKDLAQEPPLIRLVNLLIMKAIKEEASDIHIEPEENTLRVRYRIDGILHDVEAPPKHLQQAIISRIKILSNLDIAERRIPQDGRFQVSAENRRIDIRVSCVPTIFGENIVLRLLDTTHLKLNLQDLGFESEELEKFERFIQRPHGIILVTGPTGSGKTTTLYAALNKINSAEKNIITIEDPVEYRLAGVRQIQVNPKVNLTFANGLRSILRQDPDIIMVGEIRDRDTAEIAIHAALTGHLVLSTLHTNDAAGAITRLIDMGIEPFLVASSVIGIVAQRLVRTICSGCKEAYQVSDKILESIELERTVRGPVYFHHGRGCNKCLNTGFHGRTAIFELLLMEETVRELTLKKASTSAINQAAIKLGMRNLRESGLKKVSSAITTIEELMRVTEE